MRISRSSSTSRSSFTYRAIHLLGVVLFAYVTLSAFGQQGLPSLSAPDLWRPEHVPFSFTFAGKSSSQLLPTWQVAVTNARQGGLETERYTYTDPASHLRVTANIRRYPEFPDVVDWVLHFRDDGSVDTPILEDILPMNLSAPSSGDRFTVRNASGSLARAGDFAPMEQSHIKASASYESLSGDSSSGESLPFFNLQTGDHGLIAAIGWTGNWKANFSPTADGKAVLLTAGMKKTHLLLHPGEEIRTPRIVLMQWSGGDWQDAQNLWRRVLLAHYTPQDDGRPMTGPILFSSWGSEPIADKLAYVHWVQEHRIPVTVYAVDAGWYGQSIGAETDPTNPWWKNRGDWYPSPLYYPNGLAPLGQALKAAGLGFSLWLEPETSVSGRRIATVHPDWFLRSDRATFADGGPGPEVLLANLGDPAARRGLTKFVSGWITDYGVTWYRQDFNIPPERYWQLADTPDRVGISEIKHIEGLYRMWDDLLAAHPGLHIDNCASGGRRMDIEMMSRSFVVWRTDHGIADTLSEQAQTQALAFWNPETMAFESYTSRHPWTEPGPYTTPKNLYLMRLAYDAGYGVTPGAAGVENEAWVTWIKQAMGEYREVQPYFYADFYPLLSYSLADDMWTAWQWNRPKERDGLAIVLRRPASPFSAMLLGLRKINPEASYAVEVRSTYDHAPTRTMKGSDLMHLRIELPEAPSSALVFYKQR